MSYYHFEFEASLSRHGIGQSKVLWYTVIFLPKELLAQPPFDSRSHIRIVGEIGDIPVLGAWLSTGDGRRYLIVSPEAIRAAEAKVDQSSWFVFGSMIRNVLKCLTMFGLCLPVTLSRKKRGRIFRPGNSEGIVI